MKRELLYYKFLSVVYNILPNSRIKNILEDYANNRFPVVYENEEREDIKMSTNTELEYKFYDDFQLEILDQIEEHIKLGYETDEDLLTQKRIFIDENKKKYGEEYWKTSW